MKKEIKLSTLLLFGLLLSGCNFSLLGNSNNTSSSSQKEMNLEHNISIVENENCTINLSKTKAFRNDEVLVEVTNITEGYHVEKITVNGFFIDNFKFIMPDEDVEVEVFLSQELVSGEKKYYVKSIANEYALIEFESDYFAPGELVEINYTCRGNYVLDTFYVNNEAIEGTSFVMPESSAVVSGTFVNSILDTDWQVSCEASYMTAYSYWYFEYGEESLNVKVIVDDKRVCGEEFVSEGRDKVAFSDNVEIILGTKNNTKGYVTNKTYKFLVACTGKSFVQIANSSSSFGGAQSMSSLLFTSTTEIKSLDNKDGYNGYEVNMSISYDIFSIDRESALNNLTACIAIRNSTTYGGYGSSWNCYNSDTLYWNNCAYHPVIMEDGKLLER